MGVDYKATAGFGVIINENECEDLAKMTGYIPNGYQTQDQALTIDDYLVDDAWDFIEWLCEEYGMEFGYAGNSYGKESLPFLVGSVHSTRDFGFESQDSSVGFADVVNFAGRINKTADWYIGMHAG